MSNHYNEQKMLIENFRRWNEQEERKEKELVNESILGGLIGLLAVSTATLYTMAPYLKVAVHHPKVARTIAGDTSESSRLFVTLTNGIKKADDAGSYLQNFTDQFLDDDQPTMKKIKNGLLLIAFFAILNETAFPIIASPFIRVLPKIGIYVRNAIAKIKNMRKTKAGPSPEEIARMDQEIDELEELEAEQKSAIELAAQVGEVIKMIKQDPVKYAEEYDVNLSPAELEKLKTKGDAEPESKATKVVIPPRTEKDPEGKPRKAPKNLPAVGTPFTKKKK